VLAHQPELLRAFLRLYGTLWSRGVVDHATKEVARLRNARVTDCRYCRSVRFSKAREEGLTEEIASLIDAGFEESALSDRHKVVIRYADVFLVDPGGLTADLRGEMLHHFTPAQIVELTAGLALFMGFSKIAVALGQEPASMPTTIVPTPDVPAV
jgi:AhpD family alkylhydroperoxidase